MTLTRRTSLCNTVCALLMAALILCQFLPFWTAPDGGSRVSIAGYVWLPEDHKDLTGEFEALYDGGFSLNQLILAPASMLPLGILGIALCLYKRESPFPALVPLIAGGLGVWGFMTQPALQAGSAWMLHPTLSALLLVAAAAALVSGVQAYRKT